MRIIRARFLLIAAFVSGVGVAQQPGVSASQQTDPAVNTAPQPQSPAQSSIASAQRQIDADPKKVQAYNEMALACLRRSRETADSKYLKDAEAALAQGLKLDAGDFQLRKTQVALMLARHEYAQAKESATALHRQTPDDVMTYGYLAEADFALGNYAEAEKNAQWMLNLRANNIPGLLIGAELRNLYGDAPGAIQFLSLAYSETSPAESEELAWIANRIASIQIESGQIDAAAQSIKTAEQLFHPYPYTTENMARLRMEQNRPGDAVLLLKQAKLIDADPDLVYRLALAQEAAGQLQEARASYSEFEQLANTPGDITDEARRDTILMYAATPANAPKALVLAQQDIKARQDVWTLDAYAWALYANADYTNANEAIQKAMAVGIQSAQIFDHAGHIAAKMNRAADAAKYFQLAIRANPASEYAADAVKFAGPSVAADSSAPGTSSAEPKPLLADGSSGKANLPAPSKSNPYRHESSGTVAAPTFAAIPDALLTPKETSTDRLIHSAQGKVSADPKNAKAYAALGAAYFQRARETGDVSDYQLAEQSLAKSLDLVSIDFSAAAALGTLAEVCMGEHRFDDALTYSQKALSLGTGDVSPFAIVGDAYADMGEYDKAAAAYGRLTPPDMTLAPRAAYARDSRLSYLKFVAGDTAAAIDLMKTSVAEGVEAQLPSENLAWLYYELGEYLVQAGDTAAADQAYVTALTIHPGDYRALAALARLRANYGRYSEAIVLYQKAIAVVPMPLYIAELGDLYAKAGNHAEARKQYALVEYIGLLGHINQVLHNRDLALFYADRDMKLEEAVSLAKKELEVRHDIYTWDTLAWALYKSGKLTEAAEASDKALQFGTRDALLFFHAGMIAERRGQREAARADLQEAMQINPHFHLLYSATAQEQLSKLQVESGKQEGPVQNGR